MICRDYFPNLNNRRGKTEEKGAGGAEFAAIAANTAHIVFAEISRQSPLPLVGIVEETCRSAQANNCRRVVVFGTAFTMSSGLYVDAFARYGGEAFVPAADEQKTIHNAIFPHLQEGVVLPEEKTAVLRSSKHVAARDRPAPAL